MTSIEWTDKVWNCVVGCSRVSTGCERCYAERVAHRGMAKQHKGLTVLSSRGPRWTGEVRFLPERLSEPLEWRKPKKIFVNSMSDLFHESLTNEQIAAVFGVMAAAPKHTFQVLTKRPERMLEWFRQLPSESWHAIELLKACAREHGLTRDQLHDAPFQSDKWPLRNVWLGVSCEDQKTADERIPLLLQTPAKVHFLSCEPLLGPIDLRGWGSHAPVSPPPDISNKWSDYQWEDWIPADLRRLVEDFWSENYGRGPVDWLRDHVVQQVPRTGASLTFGREGKRSTWLVTNKMATDGVRGRYVHMWNNIGRVVADDGQVYCTAGGHGSGWLSRWIERDGTYQHLLNLVIVGSESGGGARPMDIAWARSIVDQCTKSEVAVFTKQISNKMDRKGGNPEYWPAGNWPRQFPEVRRG